MSRSMQLMMIKIVKTAPTNPIRRKELFAKSAFSREIYLYDEVTNTKYF